MPEFAINGHGVPTQQGGWVDPTPPIPDSVWCYASAPVARAGSNGTRPCLFTSARMYVAGYNASRTVELFCTDQNGGQHRTAAFVMGANGDALPTNSRAFTSQPFFANLAGGTLQLGMYVSGAVRPGMAAASGRTVFPGTTSFFQNVTLAGYVSYAESPSAVLFDSVTPSADGRSAILRFRNPVTDGGAPLSHFYIQYATNATFTQGVGFRTTGNSPYQVTNISPGTRYYYRICAANGVTSNWGLAGGEWSQTLNAIQPQPSRSGKIWNGTTWVDPIAKIWNGSAWVDPILKVWNGTAWVDNP